MIGRRNAPSAAEEDKPRGFDDFELRLGDVMRGERATLGKSLLDVQRELKIKATYVAAIENADVSAFETPGFVAGYVRSYARYLGMDPEWAYKRFCDEAGFAVERGIGPSAGKSGQAKTGAKPSGVKSSGGAKPAKSGLGADPFGNPNATFVPRAPALLTGIEPRAVGSLLVLIALIGGIGYGGWSVLQQIQRVQLAPVDQAPGAVADLDPLANVAAVPDSGVDAGVKLPAADQSASLRRPQALDVPVMVARDGPIAAIKPGSLGALSAGADDPSAVADTTDSTGPGLPSALAAVTADATQGFATPGAADAQNGAQPGTPKVVADAAPAVQIVAVRPAWVRVRAADGTVLFEKVLDAGERYTVPQTAEPAKLRAGNSGSVYFLVNGKAYGPAAPGPSVAKNVVLTPSDLQANYQVADLAADPALAGAVNVAQAQIGAQTGTRTGTPSSQPAKPVQPSQ